MREEDERVAYILYLTGLALGRWRWGLVGRGVLWGGDVGLGRDVFVCMYQSQEIFICCSSGLYLLD